MNGARGLPPHPAFLPMVGKSGSPPQERRPFPGTRGNTPLSLCENLLFAGTSLFLPQLPQIPWRRPYLYSMRRFLLADGENRDSRVHIPAGGAQ
jgi:hypothetical protein